MQYSSMRTLVQQSSSMCTLLSESEAQSGTFSFSASKQGHVVKNWKKRWFVCNTGTRQISYWESEEGAAAGRGKKGSIDVKQVLFKTSQTITIVDVSGKRYNVKCEVRHALLLVVAFCKEFAAQPNLIPKAELAEMFGLDADLRRVKVVEDAILDSDGTYNWNIVVKHGLSHFANRTATPELTPGMCVFVDGDTLGVIRHEVDGGFVVQPQVGKLQTVPASSLQVCENLDATKASSQKDYLISLSELVGPDENNVAGKQLLWKEQARLLLKAVVVDLGHLPSVQHAIPAAWTNWASFDGYINHANNSACVEMRMKGSGGRLTREEAGVMDLCTDFSKLLGASMRSSKQ